MKGTRNNVVFMAGGVGKGEMAEMEAMSDKYNLKVVLATQEGFYLAGCPVSIYDAQEMKVLEVDTHGPWLYARLPDGRYTVKAIHGGVEKKRSLQVDDGLEVVMLHWDVQ